MKINIFIFSFCVFFIAGNSCSHDTPVKEPSPRTPGGGGKNVSVRNVNNPQNKFNGVDFDKLESSGYDANGFDKNGIHKDTGDQFDQEGLDKWGYGRDGKTAESRNRIPMMNAVDEAPQLMLSPGIHFPNITWEEPQPAPALPVAHIPAPEQSALREYDNFTFAFMRIPGRILEPEDSQLIVTAHQTAQGRALNLAPNVSYFKRLCRENRTFCAQAENFFDIYLGFSRQYQFNALLNVLKNDSTAFLRLSDIGTFKAIVDVRKLYYVHTQLHQVISPPPSPEHERRKGEAFQNFMAYLNASLRTLHENRDAEHYFPGIQERFEQFFSEDGSFEKNLQDLLILYGRVAVPQLYNALRSAVFAIVLDESFFKYLQDSLAHSPSGNDLFERDFQRLQQIVRHTLESQIIDENNMHEVILRIWHVIERIRDFEADTTLEGPGRVQFHSSNAVNKMIFHREFYELLRLGDPRTFETYLRADKPLMTFFDSFIDIALQRPGYYKERIDYLYQVLRTVATATIPGAGNFVIPTPAIQYVEAAIARWKNRYAVDFGVGNPQIAAQLRQIQATNEYLNGTHVNFQTAFPKRTFYPAPDYNLEVINSITGQRTLTPVTCLNQYDMEYIFRILAQRPDIQFAYPPDGCFARAQIMSDYLAGLGINSAKIFSYAQDRAHLAVRSINAPEGAVRWGYHVAPVVLTGARCEEVRVFDPSLNKDRPLTGEEWYTMQIPARTPNLGLRLTYVPPSNRAGNGIFYQYTDRYAYTPLNSSRSGYNTFGQDERVYGEVMRDARTNQTEKSAYLLITNTVKDYMVKKGLW